MFLRNFAVVLTTVQLPDRKIYIHTFFIALLHYSKTKIDFQSGVHQSEKCCLRGSLKFKIINIVMWENTFFVRKSFHISWKRSFQSSSQNLPNLLYFHTFFVLLLLLHYSETKMDYFLKWSSSEPQALQNSR